VAGEGLARHREKVLGERNILRLMLWLAAPMFVSASLSSLYELVDTFWLSRLGDAALATPTVSWPYRGVLMSISFGLASSLSALVGQYVGAGKIREAEKSIGTVAGLLAAIVVPGSLLLAAITPLYLEAIGVPPSVRVLAARYLTVLVLATPFSAAFMLFTFAVSAAGDTRTPMYISAAATLINAVLDPVLIFSAGLGVLGAALATAAANMFSAAYAVYSFATGRHGVKLGLRDLVPEPGIARLVARVSLPITAQRLGTSLGFVGMVGIVSGLGKHVIAAYSIGQVMLSIDHIIVFPLARATSIVVGQALGAGMEHRARRAAYTGLAVVTAAAAAYIAALEAAAGPFIAVFTRSPATYEAALHMIRIFAPSVIGFDVFIVANVVARASGHTLPVSILGLARLWGLRIPLSWLLAYRLGMGDKGLWTGMAISNCATGAAAAAWLLSGTWAEKIID